ncbi:MAG TPA: hypothetical protein VFD13_00165, partial [Candidatus Kapabacteria bacterium]|nr:hypothetical protein [Candidatus Kapabacteria bacterium]
MNHRNTYPQFFRASALLAVAMGVALAGISNEVRAQDCSRNMLRISGPQSYVATPDVQALHLTHGFTIECWARLSVPVSFSGIVDKGSYGIFLNVDSAVFGMVRK